MYNEILADPAANLENASKAQTQTNINLKMPKRRWRIYKRAWWRAFSFADYSNANTATTAEFLMEGTGTDFGLGLIYELLAN